MWKLHFRIHTCACFAFVLVAAASWTTTQIRVWGSHMNTHTQMHVEQLLCANCCRTALDIHVINTHGATGLTISHVPHVAVVVAAAAATPHYATPHNEFNNLAVAAAAAAAIYATLRVHIVRLFILTDDDVVFEIACAVRACIHCTRVKRRHQRGRRETSVLACAVCLAPKMQIVRFTFTYYSSTIYSTATTNGEMGRGMRSAEMLVTLAYANAQSMSLLLHATIMFSACCAHTACLFGAAEQLEPFVCLCMCLATCLIQQVLCAVSAFIVLVFCVCVSTETSSHAKLSFMLREGLYYSNWSSLHQSTIYNSSNLILIIFVSCPMPSF